MKRKVFVFLMAFCFVSLVSIAQEKKDEFPKTKFSGLIFGDYYYNAVRDTAFSPVIAGNKMTGNNAAFGKPNENSVQIRRVLFAIEHKLSKNLEGVFRLESNPDTKTGDISAKDGSSDPKYGVYIKDCYIKWGYFKTHNLQFGLFSTGAWDVSENFWGHRYVEKTITDLRGATAARDLGLGLNGKLDSIGKFKYALMFGEGTGVKSPSADWYKRFYATLSFSPILELNDKKDVVKEMTINLFADIKDQKSNLNLNYMADESKGAKMLNGDVKNFTLMAGYKELNKFAFGLECYYNISNNAFNDVDFNTLANSKIVNQNGMGISVFGSYYINEQIDVFGRFDYFDPNNNANKNAKGYQRNYIIAGVGYSPVKGFTVSPNVLVETYEKKVDTIINSDGSLSDRTFKSSISPRITLLYVFK